MRKRVWLGLALTMCLTLIVMAMIAIASFSKAYAGTPVDFIYRYWDGTRVVEEQRHADCTELDDIPSDGYVLSGWYIARSFSDGDRPKVQGTANIIIENGREMELTDGIEVPVGSTLNIYTNVWPDGTKDTGKLRVDRSENNTAAIGGNNGQSAGTINIYGAEINVKGGAYNYNGGAGIGGGSNGGGGYVNIYGGKVNATGGGDDYDGGAGIGGGYLGSGGTCTIYGGNVTAKGGNDGAGIGGGNGANGGTIEIYGGTVNATGRCAAGIGGGEEGSGGTTKIFGGNVTAQGGDEAAGIGGGQDDNNGHGAYGGTIMISGGTVKATGGELGAGIGGGQTGSSGSITISGGNVTATGGRDGAGIGGGDLGDCETITILGGTVTATGGYSTAYGDGGAGIGGGNDKPGGTINISNATVTATGGTDAAGIGGGDSSDGGTITITNSTVTATGGKYSAGIGGGETGKGGQITINGRSTDVIKATGGKFGAGIGGGQNGDGGTVKIHGGDITTSGGDDSAGIGGGEGGHGATVEITGGKVTALGSPGNTTYEGGAGIGGGQYGNGGTVTVSGGEVIAKGGIDGAGIGGGDESVHGGTVNISGGSVTATGGECAAGIGGGDADNAFGEKGKGATVTITGGTVTATGGKFAAGIGASEEGCDGGTVVIGVDGDTTAGPTVTATGGYKAAGIGGGDAYFSAMSNHSKYLEPVGADVTIYSGSVTATGGGDGAGIGGGEGGSNKSTKIYGGTVIATGGQGDGYDGGAGIGSGDDAFGEVANEERPRHTSGGTIEIHGGKVTATGGPDGAGIGGGDLGSGGTIKITNGTVVATGGGYGAGIGGGQARGAGTVTITGGNITARGGSVTDEDDDDVGGGAGIGGGANYRNSGETGNDPFASGNLKGTYPAGSLIGTDTISISDNCTVFADGGSFAAGIGGGSKGCSGSITIDGETSIDAKGGERGAGIGGGDGEGGYSGAIVIKNGTVKATGGKNGGSGIGTGAACNDPGDDTKTVNITVNGGNITARAGAMEEVGQYDCGAAIGTGGTYYKSKLNDVEIQLDDEGNSIKIPDVDRRGIFKGNITLNGGTITAYASKVKEGDEEYFGGALNIIGTTREDNLKAKVPGATVAFNGATVYMYPGANQGEEKYSQAVRASSNSITFRDDLDYQHVWYLDHELEAINTENANQRVPVLTKSDVTIAGIEFEGIINTSLAVVEPRHAHNFTYTANGNTITATCSVATCPLPEHKATLTITKPLHEVYGDGKDAKATITDENSIRGDAKVSYFKATKSGDVYTKTGEALSSAPTDAGDYWAEITVGGVTAGVGYTIDKADNPTVVMGEAVVKPGGSAVDGGTVDLSANVTKPEGVTGAASYAIAEGDTSGCTLNGSALTSGTATPENTTVTVNVTVAEDDNYKALYAPIKVTVTNKGLQVIEAADVVATYGDTDKSVSAVVTTPETDGGAISYAVKEGGEFIDVDAPTGALTIKKAGTAYVTVTAAGLEASGDSIGYLQTTKDVKVTVNPKQATITAKNQIIAEGNAPVDSEYEVEGLLTGETLSTVTMSYQKDGISLEAADFPLQASTGIYDIVPSNADANGNYDFTYVNGKLNYGFVSPVTVTPTATVMVGGQTVDLASNVQMNGATGNVTYSFGASDITGYDEGTGCSLTGSSLKSGNITGTVTVYVSAEGDTIYSELAATPITVTIISKYEQIISAPDMSATYGDTDKAVHANVVYPLTGSGAVTYAVKDGSEDYISVNETSGALKIESVPPDGLAYVTVTAAETATCQAATDDVLVHISKAPVTVTAINQTTYVGGPVPDLSAPVLDTHYTAEGILDWYVYLTGAPPTLTYEKDGVAVTPDTTTPGTYDIVPSGADAGGNYAINYVNGTLTVEDRVSQSITASDMTVTYGETGKSVSATTDGDGAISYAVKPGSESYIAVDETTGALTTIGVPSDGVAYVTVTAAGTDIYAPATKDVAVTINKAQLTVKATDEQMYVGETPGGLYEAEGLVGYDTLTTPPTMTYQKDGAVVDPQTAPAGSYTIVPSGADSDGKYTISYVNGTLTINEGQPSPGPNPTKSVLVYDLAGGSLNGNPEVVMIEATNGETVRLLAAPVREGYTFKCWKYAAGWEAAPGAEYKVDGNHVFVAVWESSIGSKNSAGISMYRLYNPNSGEHFYTADLHEAGSVVSAGWNYEGIGWMAPETSNNPVYRLYNANGGEHHYTLSADERDFLVFAGWTYEGIGWYSDEAQSVPLYREYNPNAFANNHNYTVSVAEHESLTNIGWRDEGIGWYGVATE